MSASKLDAVYRSILITKFFTKGWGKPDNLRRLFEFRKIVSNREECYKLIPPDYPITITKEEKRSDFHILEGHFLTPMETLLPGVVPPCARNAHFQVVMPTKWLQSDYKPMCVHLAGTGDHFFWRRRNLMAKPLMKEAGIGAIILENPFYGLRKPQDQVRSSLHNVSDIFVMGGCLILETLVLLHWCERNGLGPLGVTGLSMGGHMASLAATNWPKPLVLVPCLSWSTASAVFTQGVMSNSINWELLETQFFSDGRYRDNLAKMVTIVDEAFLAGRTFAQRFSRNNVPSQSAMNNTFNLPSILNETENNMKTFDITNPNKLSCQGLLPEFSQRYVLGKYSANGHNNSSVKYNASLENLKSNKKISETLYNKITSEENFQLDPSEINELNKLAFQSVNSEINKTKANTPSSDMDSVSNVVLPGQQQKAAASSSNQSLQVVINKSENIKPKVLSQMSELAVQMTRDKASKQHTVPTVSSTTEAAKPVSVESKIIAKIMTVTEQESNDVEKPIKATEKANMARNILANIPFLSISKDEVKVDLRNREALQFMRGVMDECTHLGNFSVPFDTSLIIAVCAKHDAYVPRGDSGALEELWPGAEVRYIDAGHVSAYVLHQKLFRSCIVEAFEKSKKKWVDGKHVV